VTPRQSPDTGSTDDLIVSVDHLFDQLRVICDVLDAIREDLNWLARNPLRIELQQPGTVAGPTTSATADPPKTDPSEPLPPPLDQLAGCLRRTLAAVSSGQLETIAATLDEAHSHLLVLTRGDVRAALHGHASPSPAIDSTAPADATESPTEPLPVTSPPPRPGQLF
jgi:hypothetical protein